MRKLRLSAAAIVLLAICMVVAPTLAQQPSPKSHPGFWGEIMPPPAPEGGYGLGLTSTERMVESCTALEWSVRTDETGKISGYGSNYQTGYCLGWINSAMAFLNFHNDAGKHTLGVCMPEDMQSMEVVKLFLDYANNNVDDTKYNPSLLIYWALLEKYPCEKSADSSH